MSAVVAIDVEGPKLHLAATLGAEHLVNAATVDPVVAIQNLGGLDVAVVLAASPLVFEQAFASLVGIRQDLAEVFALHAAGKTRVIAETRSLESVNDAIAEALSGKVPARLVFDYAAIPAAL